MAIKQQTDGLDKAFICSLFISEKPVLGNMLFDILINYLENYIRQITVIGGTRSYS